MARDSPKSVGFNTEKSSNGFSSGGQNAKEKTVFLFKNAGFLCWCSYAEK